MFKYKLSHIKKDFSFIEGIIFVLIVLLAVFIPFWNLGTSLTIVSLLLCFLYKISKEKLTFINPIVTTLFTCFFGYKVLVSLLNGNVLYDLNYFKKIAPFLILVFVLPSINKKQIEIVKFFFVFVFFCFQVIVCFRVLPYLLEFNSLTLLNGPEINNKLYMERPYLGFFSLLSLIMLLSESEEHQKIKFLGLSYLVFTALFLGLISARMSLISLMILIFWFFYIKTKINLKLKLINLVPLLGFIVLLFFNSSILGKRFDQIQRDPRVTIWNSGLIILKNTESVFFGLKSDKLVEDKLINNYKNIKNKEMRAWYLKSKFNTHNQYLHELLSFGLFSFILLFLILIKISCINGISNYGFILLIMFSLFLFVENLFHRQMGVTAFVFYNLLFLKKNDE